MMLCAEVNSVDSKKRKNIGNFIGRILANVNIKRTCPSNNIINMRPTVQNMLSGLISF